MELPIELKSATEKLVEGTSSFTMINNAKELSRRYMEESGTGRSLLTDVKEAAVYSLMRMPATYGAVASILEQVCLVSDFVPRSLLDAGAGTGAGSWAANEYFKLDNITCLEREVAMQCIGKKLMEESSDDALKRAKWISCDLCNQSEEDLKTGNCQYSSDLVIASYVLNEMSLNDRMNVVKWLWKNTEKMLVIVEPGTPVGFENIRRIREMLLEEGAYIAAPCTHMSKCHVNGDDWCHFRVRVQRGKLHKMLKEADAPYEDEKYSYIALSKEPCNMLGECKRVMRHPMTEKGRITLTLCGEEGICTQTITKKEKNAYKTAKKTNCGDIY